MLNDFVNLRSLDRFRQIGRGCQLLGAVLILGPTLAAISSAITPVPPSFLDPLPDYNPSVFALHHPSLVALVSAVIGLLLVAIGTGFLAARPWALVAMRRACWTAACISTAGGVLWALSIHGVSNLKAQVLGVGSSIVAIAFALLFWRVDRELDKPEYAVRFHGPTNQ